MVVCLAVGSVGRMEGAEWDAGRIEQAKGVLTGAVKDKAFPGCVIEVGSSGGPLWREAFGWFDYSQTTVVTTNTIYDLASLTKVVGTTTVVLRLVAEGRMKLSDPVVHFLPEFAHAATNDAQQTWRAQMTVEHLLTHSSGLPAWKPFYHEARSYRDMIRLVTETPIEASPGSRVRYSDLGMMLLGELASRAAGQPLANLEQDLVFDPLKLTTTQRNPPKSLWERIPPTEKLPDSESFVHGRVHDENARAAEGVTGHAGLFSTAGDVGRFAREWLRALEGRSELLPREWAREFTRRRSDDHSRALGWAVLGGDADSPFSASAFGHTGFTGTSIWIDPERDLYVVLLSNRVHPTRENRLISGVRRDLARAIFGQPEAPVDPATEP